MSWNVQNYGTTGFVKFPLGTIIAALMQAYQIDICALIEVSNNGHLAIRNDIHVALTASGYRANWRHDYVNVGNEGVAYFWHEAAAGANAFLGQPYTNSPRPICGQVFHDAHNARLFFPQTGTRWASVAGQPNGRRAGYCAFITNDGAPARRFSFLDLHTPFAQATQIQAYSAHVYARAREIVRVETTDAIAAAGGAHAAAVAATQLALAGAVAAPPPAAITQAIVDVAHQWLVWETGDAQPVGTAMQVAATGACDAAVGLLATHVGPALTQAAGQQIALAAALAAGVPAAFMATAIVAPTAPAAAGPAAAATAIQNAIAGALGVAPFQLPAVRNARNLRANISTAVRNAITVATGGFVFPNLPTDNLHAAVIAGDFNINFPDITDYTLVTGAVARLGGPGNNAYTPLLALAAPRPAAIAGETTRSGVSSYSGNRIYRLESPVAIQHINPHLPNYVPLDVTPMIGVEYLGYSAWETALRALATAQGIAWAPLVRDHKDAITAAFDSMTVINDTAAYTASRYDNIFVRNAVQNASGVIDVISELGSWGADPRGRWPAARRGLNAIARAKVTAELTAQPFLRVKGFELYPDLDDATQAAVFFDKFISDHLPVWVEIVI